jgi:maleylpyruvate isomerase
VDSESVTTATWDWMRSGEAAVADAVAGLDDAAIAEPSPLPGWTRGHIVTHLARNADALRNLLDWGRTGAEHPMYPSREARAADIEAGAGRPAAEQRADLTAAALRLAEELDAYPPDRWDVPVRGGTTGQIMPVGVVPWLRVREVWLHLVDLDVGVPLSAMPLGVAERLCTQNLASYAARDDAPAVVVTLLPGGERTRLGPESGAAVEVRGSARELVGWLTGRSHDLLATAGRRAPELPPWL